MTTCTDPNCDLPPPPGPNDVPTTVAALCANLIRACDEYNRLRKDNGLEDAAIGMLIHDDLARLPDQGRVSEVFRIADRLKRGAEAEARLAERPAPSVQWSPSAIAQVIDRLLAEAPALTDGRGTPVPGQAPAIEVVLMFTTGQAVRGALSKTPEGALRLMSPGQENGRAMLVEQFFDYAAVSAIAIPREVTSGPGIILPRGRVS